MDLEEQIARAVRHREEANKPVWELIQKITRNKDLARADKEALLKPLFESLSDKDILETFAYDAFEFDAGTSFRSSMNSLQRLKLRLQDLGLDVFPGANPKLKDRRFASLLGIPVPATYFENVALEEIELVPNSVLKPTEGVASKGVFYITNTLSLRSIKTSKVYSSVKDARVEIDRYESSISKEGWILEEAILDEAGRLARDFKVFAFYGVSGMFLEIDRFSFEKPRFATYTESGRQIERGPRYRSFPGSGVPKGLREMAEALSLAAPVPFLRLDFYLGVEGLCLGEITPMPGGTYAGDQYEEVDRMLGHHFAEAEARLFVDMLKGKKFQEFKEAYELDY